MNRSGRTTAAWLGFILTFTACHAIPAEESESRLDLVLTWGHRSSPAHPFVVGLVGHDLEVGPIRLVDGEAGDSLAGVAARTRAGGGDVDGLSCTLTFPTRIVATLTNAHSLWRYLWDHGDPGATRRLQSDPAFRPDSRRIEVKLDESGATGFCLTADQCLRQRAFWFPELDLFVSAGSAPVSFDEHQTALGTRQGQRVLDRVGREPEASYGQFTSRWEDLGSPAYSNPHSVPPGHIVCLAWDGALYKFGVDRSAAVINDYGKSDEFRLGFDFGGPMALLKAQTGQHLSDGLPVITTTFEKDGVACQVEQFVVPLEGASAPVRGDLPMAFLQRVRLTGHGSDPIPFRVVLDRGKEGAVTLSRIPARDDAAAYALVDAGQRTLLVIEGKTLPTPVLIAPDPGAPTNAFGRRHQLEVRLQLPAGGATEFVVKMPSPAIAGADTDGSGKLLAFDFDAARDSVFAHWNGRLERGARFQVPEDAVNTLFRANLWHAFRLPRRHGGLAAGTRLDLPYSNFAYTQEGTPWPVNQAVYVDYMLYDLRGHHDVAEEELLAIFRANQEPNGHVGGYANWGVYTPAMLYAVGQHFLLSGDRASFDRLLSSSLRALDWCLGELRGAGGGPGAVSGLVNAPLNDLSHDSLPWAFNQAYFVGGLTTFGRALGRIDHPRAAECTLAAKGLRDAVERAFARASAQSPAVELADGSWIPYVPSQALATGRQFAVWYPTDVDTGSLHLPRLRALDPLGPLTGFLLNDHEDNLLFRQWGAINEPVYNMQGTVYLLRDEPEAAIRTFYTTMASAFSHSVFEPVEHRWGWGQYFGPPSTDGAWFELYRNMLIRELDDDALLLGQATPRAWLANGQSIAIQRAPTYFGPLDLRIDSAADAGRIAASVTFSDSTRPTALVVRLRHPRKHAMRSVTVNGEPWTGFDAAKEWVRIDNPRAAHYEITATY